MPMTREHRRRLLFMVALALTGLGIAAGTTSATEGPLAGLAVFAMAAVLPGALIGVVAYVWSANDRDDAERGFPPVDRDRLR